MFAIHPERPQDQAAIDHIVDLAFGPDRLQKTVYKLRQAIDHIPALAFVARDRTGTVYASIRYWPVTIGAKWSAILLGPLAVHPERTGQGMGKALMRHSLNYATALGHTRCLLVGDRPYYAPFGFISAIPFGLTLPGPVDPDRFLVKELLPDAMRGVSGPVGPANPS